MGAVIHAGLYRKEVCRSGKWFNLEDLLDLLEQFEDEWGIAPLARADHGKLVEDGIARDFIELARDKEMSESEINCLEQGVRCIVRDGVNAIAPSYKVRMDLVNFLRNNSFLRLT